jgi:hypothetical protein
MGVRKFILKFLDGHLKISIFIERLRLGWSSMDAYIVLGAAFLSIAYVLVFTDVRAAD